MAAALAGCILFATGCIRHGSLSADGSEIRFSAGTSLLRDDVPDTKFGTLISGTSFSNGSSFLVYGRRNTDALIFSPREVSLSASLWGYTNPEYWEWTSSQDYYDFLGLYLGDLYDPNRASTPLPSCDTGDPMSASVSYDPSVDQFDLMLAGTRRTYNDPGGRTSAVALTFEHMLSAVKVKVINGSTSKSLTLTGYHFENLVSRGTAKVEATYDQQGNPTFSWINTSRLAASVGGTANLSAAQLTELGSLGFIPHNYGVTQQNNTLDHNYYDLMIPQSHNERIGVDGWPALVLEYTPTGNSPTTARILLKDVYTDPELGEPTLISSWQRGKVYTYVIKPNLDGGVQIHVITSDWDPVIAETPGLLLPGFDN